MTFFKILNIRDTIVFRGTEDACFAHYPSLRNVLQGRRTPQGLVMLDDTRDYIVQEDGAALMFVD